MSKLVNVLCETEPSQDEPSVKFEVECEVTPPEFGGDGPERWEVIVGEWSIADCGWLLSRDPKWCSETIEKHKSKHDAWIREQAVAGY